MVELCIPKSRMFLFFDFNGFCRENDVTRLTAKFKFQVMAKQINNFERALRDRNKCEKFFGKAQLVRELLSFDFCADAVRTYASAYCHRLSDSVF